MSRKNERGGGWLFEKRFEKGKDKGEVLGFKRTFFVTLNLRRGSSVSK